MLQFIWHNCTLGVFASICISFLLNFSIKRLFEALSFETIFKFLVIELPLLAKLADIGATIEIVLEQDVADRTVISGAIFCNLSNTFKVHHVVINYCDTQSSINRWLTSIPLISVAKNRAPVLHLRSQLFVLATFAFLNWLGFGNLSLLPICRFLFTLALSLSLLLLHLSNK